MRKLIGSLVAGWILLTLPFTASAFSTPEGYNNNRLVIATEPGVTDSEYVGYYENDELASLSDIDWVEGQTDHGQAVTLGGDGDYLSIGYDQLRLTNFSVSMWVNWQGGEAGQNLLTIWQDEDNYVALSPYTQNDQAPNKDGKILNGLMLDVTIQGETATAFRASLPTVKTSLPQNEWHHIALVAKQPTIAVYVDGARWAETTWVIGLRELNARYMHIGDSIGDSPFLNALVDDVEIYASELSGDQVKMLAGGVDPLSEGATVPTTTTRSPITTTTTAAASVIPDETANDNPSLDLALTVGGVGISIFVLLTIGSLIFGKKPPTDPPEQKGETA